MWPATAASLIRAPNLPRGLAGPRSPPRREFLAHLSHLRFLRDWLCWPVLMEDAHHLFRHSESPST